jgi:hypothetical protein
MIIETRHKKIKERDLLYEDTFLIFSEGCVVVGSVEEEQTTRRLCPMDFRCFLVCDHSSQGTDCTE